MNMCYARRSPKGGVLADLAITETDYCTLQICLSMQTLKLHKNVYLVWSLHIWISLLAVITGFSDRLTSQAHLLLCVLSLSYWLRNKQKLRILAASKQPPCYAIQTRLGADWKEIREPMVLRVKEQAEERAGRDLSNLSPIAVQRTVVATTVFSPYYWQSLYGHTKILRVGIMALESGYSMKTNTTWNWSYRVHMIAPTEY